MGLVASTVATASAEEDTLKPLETFTSKAFSAQAEELPKELVKAVKRDLGLNPGEYLAHAAFAKSAAEAVAALQSEGVDVNAAIVDELDLTVYVNAEVDVPVVEKLGAIVKIGEPKTASVPDDQTFYAAADLKGGLGYGTLENPDDPTDPGSGSRCSVGFNGTANGGQATFLTAGHCGAPYAEGHPWFHIPVDGPIFDDVNLTLGTKIGENGDVALGGGADAGLVAITEADWTPLPQVATWGGGTGAPNDGESVKIYDTTPVIEGQPICKSGATSGWTCGTVLFAEETMNVVITPDDPNTPEDETVLEEITAFLTSACVLAGDSGGAIVSGNYAVGVNSFSTEPTTASCDGWDNDDISGGFAVSGGSINAESLFGNAFDLAIHVGQPDVSAPAEGGTVDPTPTFQGTVEAAEGASVTVAIEGGPTVDGTVNEGGQWSAGVTTALAPGTYTYTATAAHTANGASDVTTSEPTTGTFVVAAQAVEDLVVTSPTDGQTASDPRTPFSGTGEPGATVTLSVDGDELGSTQVEGEGSWTLTPDSDLPVAVRFDATLTQTAGDDVQDVVITDLGVRAPGVKITGPEDGATVAGDAVITGTSAAGASVEVVLTSSDDSAGPVDGELVVEDNGNWTFTPAAALTDGQYTVTATASLDGGDPELSSSQANVAFTVVTDSGDEDADDGAPLPDTGSSLSLWLVVAGVALMLAGGAALALRARRGGDSA